jgi:hypothetical protein
MGCKEFSVADMAIDSAETIHPRSPEEKPLIHANQEIQKELNQTQGHLIGASEIPA